MGIDHFWAGFEKRAGEGEQKKPWTAGQVAGAAGVGTTGTLAGHHLARAALQERAERKAVPGSKTWKHFASQLQPGDIIFSGSKDRTMGLMKDLVEAGSGSTAYHAALNMGGGRTYEHPGLGYGTQYTKTKKELGRKANAVVYRPDVSAAKKRRAVTQTPKQLKGRKYKTSKEFAVMGAKNLLIPGGGGKSCHKAPNGNIVCTSVPHHAYPDLFKDTDNVEEMRRNKKMKLVARLERTPATMRERVLAHGVYPIVKNLKWGVGAAGAAYAGKKIYDHYKQPSENAGAGIG